MGSHKETTTRAALPNQLSVVLRHFATRHALQGLAETPFQENIVIFRSNLQ